MYDREKQAAVFTQKAPFYGLSRMDIPEIGEVLITRWLFNIAMGHGPFIVDLPIKNGDFPWLC
jgi:hypothetical protein